MTTDVVVKVLAVVGGGVVGGLGLGLLAQLLARAFTIKKLSYWPRLVVQLLGGLICGWLVALWLFGGGGSGIGGTGGWGFGSGSGKGDGEKTTEVSKKDSDGERTRGAALVPNAETLSIEVLGRAVLPKEDIEKERWYRTNTEEKARLLTFAEVKEAIKSRLKNQPPLRRLVIVLYNDSPAEDVTVVSQLATWGRDLNDGKMKVDISKRDADAPRR